MGARRGLLIFPSTAHHWRQSLLNFLNLGPDGTHGRRGSLLLQGMGISLLRRLETAVTSWTGANGFASMMLLGIPRDGQSAALAPLI